MGVKSSTKPDAWTLSPQLTAAPELWRNAGFSFPFWEGSGDAMELVRGKNSATLDADELPIVVGRRLSSAGNSLGEMGTKRFQVNVSGSLEFANDTQGTVVLYLLPQGVDAAEDVYFSFEGDSSSDMVVVRPNGAGSIDWFLRGANNFNGQVAGTVMNDGDPHVLIFSGGPDGFKMYIDDQIVTTDSATVWFANIQSPQQITLNGWPAFLASVGAPHQLVLAHYIRRQVPDSVAKFIGRDPFAMLRPAGF